MFEALTFNSVSIEITGAHDNAAEKAAAVTIKSGKKSDQSYVGPLSDWPFEPLRGSHQRFPFDSAAFAFTVTSNPPLKVSTIIITNRVNGFVLDCGSVRATRAGEGSVRISFRLQRNPLVQLVSIVLLVGCASFVVLILRSKTTEALATAAASSFFSIWSIRSVLSSQIHTFPTLFDLGILTMSIAVLGAVLWRTLLKSVPRSRRRRTARG